MANLLTGLRLLLVVPVAIAFADPAFISASLLMLLLIIAIATDYFDGIVARRFKATSAQGQLFDHTTDFLFVTCGLAGAALSGMITPLLPLMIVVAFSQYVLDSYFLYRQKHLRMNLLGRWNGVMYFVPLAGIALSRFELLAGPMLWTQLISLLAYFLLASTVASIIDRAIAPLRKPSKIKEDKGTPIT
jgi:phosphatidylglycerophosphate synthase